MLLPLLLQLLHILPLPLQQLLRRMTAWQLLLLLPPPPR
tara:strand:- start:476 stop:592 length:117 start_codon:yes stop_codon:yes gene_type:complete